MRKLNSKQEIAASHVHGPMLVRAGAGTGKTTVMVERIARLIKQGHATADEILAVSYTNASVKSLGERAEAAIESGCGAGKSEGLRAHTFHSTCYEILQKKNEGFELLDKQNLWIYLRRKIEESKLPLNIFQKAADPAKFLEDFISFIERCTDELVTAARYREYVNSLRNPDATLPRMYRTKDAEKPSRQEIIARCEEVAAVYEYVEGLLAEKNLGTYGQMIARAVHLLDTDAALRARERARTKFLLIDEFQDCNHAQIKLAQLLVGDAKNIFAVGDPDQAIYRFRGASSGAFAEFVNRFPGTKCVTLAENYRSRTPILESAFGLISANSCEDESAGYRREKLESFRDARGDKTGAQPVRVIINGGAVQEAFDVVAKIKAAKVATASKWSEFAVLFRSHSQRKEAIRELGARNIPFMVLGIDLLNTDLLRDFVAVLHCVDSLSDSISLFRLALMPHFGIDLEDLNQRMRHAREGSGLVPVLEQTREGKRILDAVHSIRSKANPERVPLSAVLREAAKQFGFDAAGTEITRFVEFVKEWEAMSLTQTKKLPEFLDYLDYYRQAKGKLQSEKPEIADAVQLMTVHAAKGLEYRHVHVLRCVSNSFPSRFYPPLFEFPDALRAAVVPEILSSQDLHHEEERRLFYVAMTRAMDTLCLHGKHGRGKEKVPTRFLRELAGAESLQGQLRIEDATPFQVDVFAAAGEEENPAWLNVTGPKKSGSLSYYKIAMYQACPLKFKLHREWNLPEEPAAAQQFGAAMHRVLSDFYRSVILKRMLSQEQFLQLFTDFLADAGMENQLQHELYLKQGIKELTAFYASSAKGPMPDVIGTEQAFKVVIGGVEVAGRIDRIDRIAGEKVAITDYKTGSAKSEKDAKGSLQLSIYAIAAAKQWNYRPESLVLHNLEDDTRVEAKHTADQLAQAEEEIREVAMGIAEGNFDAKPGFHCNWCGYHSICPATKEKLYTISKAAGSA